MSLYFVQKLLCALNRDPAAQTRFVDDPAGLLAGCDLSMAERDALQKGDVGLLEMMGVNGQILMHFAAFTGLARPARLEAMREGVRRHGAVRAGVYAMTTGVQEKVAGV